MSKMRERNKTVNSKLGKENQAWFKIEFHQNG